MTDTDREDPELARLAENFDHISRTFRDRRLEFYRYVHADKCPVRHSDKHGGFWYVSGYNHALAIQHNPEVFSNKNFTIPPRPVPPLIPATLDPPEHPLFKRMLSQFFTPATAARLSPRLHSIVERLMAAGVARGRFDLVNDVMFPLMAEFTFGDVLGLPVEKAFEYARPVHNMTHRGYPHDKAAAEMAWLIEQLTGDLREGRIDPDGIMGQLSRVDFEGRALTLQELCLIAINLLIGGMGTTAFFMGSVTVFLGRNPDHRAQLIADPARVPAAIEELLRVFTPTQSFGRSVKEDVIVDGAEIKAGEKVLLGYGAANFDPEIFDDPQKVDFGRSPNRHMSFGIGPHRCLGSYIAREASVAVTRTLLEMAPAFTLIEDEVVEQDETASMFGYNAVPLLANQAEG